MLRNLKAKVLDKDLTTGADLFWYWGRCTIKINDDEHSSIVCESCLVWYHFKCVGVKKHPSVKHGFAIILCYEENIQ